MIEETSTAQMGKPIRPELLAAFAEPAFDPIVVEVADLVTVRMDGNYQVLEVELKCGHGTDDPPTDRLQDALVEAFNEAIRRVMERNVERLSEMMAAGGESASSRTDQSPSPDL